MLTESTRLRDFPALAGKVYLNTAAESIPPLCVGEAIQAYWQDKLLGMDGRTGHFAAVEACREISAKMIGLAPDEVSFCSCSSEAYNLLASALSLRSDDEVVVSDLDFPAGTTPWLRMREAPQLRVWKSVDGDLDPAGLTPLLNRYTKLVQVSLISFYNGHRLAWKPFHDTGAPPGSECGDRRRYHPSVGARGTELSRRGYSSSPARTSGPWEFTAAALSDSEAQCGMSHDAGGRLVAPGQRV